MSVASNLERQMLVLINAERAREGLAPVKLELRLNEAAEDHSEWMLNVDRFSHTGVGGSQPWDRMEDAGFDFSGSWRATENIAWQSIRGAPGLADDVENLHTALMNSPGHRANILDPNVNLIGIGIETGNFDGWNAIMVTQNFARTSAPVQLDTGAPASPPPPPVDEMPVPDTSEPDNNQPETPAPATPDQPTEPAKEYVSVDTIGDATDEWFVFRSGASGRLDGKGGNDILTGHNARDLLFGRSGDDTLIGRDGNDHLAGGSGKDLLHGGVGNDFLLGQNGDDIVVGQAGNDRLTGGVGNDIVNGGEGSDLVVGNGGDDRLVGGAGNDRLIGGSGTNTLIGGQGADDFFFGNGIDRVKDFENGDQVNLRKSQEILNFEDLINNHVEQSGNHVVIDDGLDHRMILENTVLADLDQGDFIF